MQINTYLIVTPRFRYSHSDRPYKADLKLIQKVQGTSMASNAVAIKLTLDIPDSLFAKPQLQATIKIDKNSVSPSVIEADVLDNITEMLNKQLAIDLKINMVQQQD